MNGCGLLEGAFANFTVDHPDSSDLTVQVGYWDGTAWVDRYVWDPGARLLGVTLSTTSSGSMGAYLGGVATLTATVVEDEIVDRVEFYVDNALVDTAIVPVSPEVYTSTWDTTTAVAGDHTVKALVVDTLGAAVFHEFTVSLDNANPTAAWTGPAAGAIVGGTVSLSADASDDLQVDYVQFYVDGSFLVTDYAAPYTAS